MVVCLKRKGCVKGKVCEVKGDMCVKKEGVEIEDLCIRNERFVCRM